MPYEILRTDRASDHLNEIIHYIAYDSGDVDVALDYLDRLEGAIMKLADTPYMGGQPKYSILRRQGYRVLIVEKHLVFYKVDDGKRQVTIYAIVHGRREYRNLI